ncbi:MAG: tyrosine--tRNA ligase [Ignavibacteria bacterium GWA2_54_16]|nr:MAG: tyrosine--tRNA ligase [Ignavibacteria bacterium GWA2_54_16]
MDHIKRGASEIIPEEDLVRKLERSIKTNKPLRVKLGCDPSRPDLHLGHSVVLRKLRQFQDLGHQAILIIGDFTGMIGDPSGRSKTRPALTLEDTRKNGQSYYEQATKILSPEHVRMEYNSGWLAKMNFSDVIVLASKYTVARMLERDEFTQRFKAGEPISVHEFLYPLAQAMDSVAIEADIELGGTDQKFNLLVGRDIQREYGLEPQVILTMPLLVGTDGVEKMSKSYDNYIGISESPREIYGKTLRIPDGMIYTYFELASDVSNAELAGIKLQLGDAATNPRDIKRKLARTFVTMYHNAAEAEKAEAEFDRIFVDKDVPDVIEEFRLDAGMNEQTIVGLIALAKLASSKSEARRLVEQGGVSINGDRVTDLNAVVPSMKEFILKVGKRRFLKIVHA